MAKEEKQASKADAIRALHEEYRTRCKAVHDWFRGERKKLMDE